MLFLVLLPRLQDAQHFVVHDLSAVDDFLSLQHYAFGADKPSVDFLLLLLAFLGIVNEVWRDVVHEVEPVQEVVAVAGAVLFGKQIFVSGLFGKEFGEWLCAGLVAGIDAYLLRRVAFETRHLLAFDDAYGIDVAKLFAQMRQEVVGCACGFLVEVVMKRSKLLLQDVDVLQEVRLVELAQAVLLLGNLLCRLEDWEAVLGNEGIFFPRLAFLIVEGRSGSARHEDDQNGYRDKGKEDAIEDSFGA